MPTLKSPILTGIAAGDKHGGPTQMAELLSCSLEHGFDLDDIGRRYLRWWKSGGFDTGPISAAVFELVEMGLSFAEASKQIHLEEAGLTAGCNPAHRIAPLALSSLPDNELAQAAMDEAALTHYHPLAGDVAAAVALLCRHLLNGLSWSDALEKAGQGRMIETITALQTRKSTHLNAGGYAPDVLAAAVYFVGSSKNLKTALIRSGDFARVTNYCPVLVGAIGGARWILCGVSHHGTK